jgi:chitinase
MKQLEDNKTGDMFDIDLKEAHYAHTINDFIGLIDEYGFETVMFDFRRMMGEREW